MKPFLLGNGVGQDVGVVGGFFLGGEEGGWGVFGEFSVNTDNAVGAGLCDCMEAWRLLAGCSCGLARGLAHVARGEPSQPPLVTRGDLHVAHALLALHVAAPVELALAALCAALPPGGVAPVTAQQVATVDSLRFLQ